MFVFFYKKKQKKTKKHSKIISYFNNISQLNKSTIFIFLTHFFILEIIQIQLAFLTRLPYLNTFILSATSNRILAILFNFCNTIYLSKPIIYLKKFLKLPILIQSNNFYLSVLLPCIYQTSLLIILQANYLLIRILGLFQALLFNIPKLNIMILRSTYNPIP